MIQITESKTYEHRSPYTPPIYGEPQFVADGVLRKEHYQGHKFIQLWPKKAPFCDHVLDHMGRVSSGGYVKPLPGPTVGMVPPSVWTIGEPFVVRPVSEVPLIDDKSNVTEKSCWPAPGFQMKGLKGVEATIHAFGHYPSEVLNMTDCEGCIVDLYIHGTAAHFWKPKGMVTDERGRGNKINVYCGESMSTTVVRSLGTDDPKVTVHSGVKAHIQNLDTGGIYANRRHKVDGVTKWSEGGGVFRWHGEMVRDDLTEWLLDLAPPFGYADVMLDDWWNGAYVEASYAYVSGPNNHVIAKVIHLDTREGWKDWPDAPHRHTKGNTLIGTVRT